LLCRQLALLDERAAAGAGVPARPLALAFRLKLMLAAGLAPLLDACASCGESEHLVGFSGAAGGVVCSACEMGSFELGEQAHGFMAQSLGSPLAAVPEAPD